MFVAKMRRVNLLGMARADVTGSQMAQSCDHDIKTWVLSCSCSPQMFRAVSHIHLILSIDVWGFSFLDILIFVQKILNNWTVEHA